MVRFPSFAAPVVSLRRAVATIFALVAVLPLLIAVFLLAHYEVLDRIEAQVLMLLAIPVMLIGFVLLQRLVAPIAGLVQTVGATVAIPASDAESTGPALPGLGRVSEVSQLGDAFGHLIGELRQSTERLEDLVFKLQSVNEMGELAAKIPKTEDLATLILDRTMRAVKATAGSIMLLDEAGEELRIVAARGLPLGALADVEIDLGEGIAGTVAQYGETVIVDDMQKDPRFAAEGEDGPAGAFVCFPIRVEDRIIGVVNLAKTEYGSDARGFSTGDLQFLNTLMTYMAYAIDNSRLLEQTRADAERLQQALNDLRSAQTRLVETESLRAVGQLASGMAHHLNNLLALILLRIELVLDTTNEEALRQPLLIVQRAALDAAEVVRRVRGFTSQRPVSDVLPLDVNALVVEVMELTQPRWRDDAHVKGIAIDTVMELGEIPAIAGDAAALREALTNLVLNAVDALPRGGRITVRTWAAGPHVYCSVADTGVGMAPDVRQRAIEPFFTTKSPKGVGLGLSVTHGIVQRHAGELTIASAQGEGTSITLRLPVAAARGATPPAIADVVQPAALRILIIEDHPDLRAALADTLRGLGHAVLHAEGGREGLARLMEEPGVDLVLTDLGMPDMNGWEVARAVKGRWPDITVGLVTGWGDDPDANKDERAAVDFIIAKPIRPDALARALARVRRD